MSRKDDDEVNMIVTIVMLFIYILVGAMIYLLNLIVLNLEKKHFTKPNNSLITFIGITWRTLNEKPMQKNIFLQ